MESLFDIAAGLSQYEEGSKDNNKQKLHPQSALGILDETFETIYGSRQYRSTNRKVPLLRSTSMIQLQSTRLSESKSSDALDARLHRLASFKFDHPTAASSTPPSDKVTKQNNSDRDPDVTAKAVLREVTSEVDQLMVTSTSSTEEEELLLRMLSEKYVHARLSKLPGTPFVLLVRKKVAQKLQHLEHHLCSHRESNKLESENNNNRRSDSSSSTPFDSIPTVKSLQKLTVAQQEMLQNLLRLPKKQLLKLPKAQLELVQFAERYDKLVKATPDELQHLPIEHQQLVRIMQRQQEQLRTDESR
ncbi:hypothetical protein GQ600_12246 [Phytophthora cactorum]|nr:hypothetical protein GQ600_12246 [Phytophthora cactorum]